MAAQGQMIVKLPNSQIEVKARRRLQEPGAFEAFLEEFQNTLIQMKETDVKACVGDLDVSQNPLTASQFEMLFNALALAGVKVQRFRMFGCPALNDEAMRHLADHFTQDLTSETAPTEMHLSDCAITTDGFLLLMSAIEEKELYPTGIMGFKKVPLYLRIENNYIDEAVIQEKVDAGIIKAFRKVPGARMDSHDPSVKINLVVRQEGKYQQKTGEPPAPEDAPAPKDVFDNRSQPGGRPGGNNWQQARPQWANGGQGWQPPAAQALAAGRWQARPQVVRPLYGAGTQGGVGARVPQTVGPRPGPWNQQGGWQIRGSAGTAADRSRTPAGRTNGSGPYPPSGPPPKKNSGLPHPWEEQWSDDYQIPYYWNSETGEALWERPTA